MLVYIAIRFHFGHDELGYFSITLSQRLCIVGFKIDTALKGPRTLLCMLSHLGKQASCLVNKQMTN